MFNPARALIGLCLSHGAGFFKKTTMERKKLFESTEDCEKAMKTIEAFKDLVDRFDSDGYDDASDDTKEAISFLYVFTAGYLAALEEVKR